MNMENVEGLPYEELKRQSEEAERLGEDKRRIAELERELSQSKQREWQYRAILSKDNHQIGALRDALDYLMRTVRPDNINQTARNMIQLALDYTPGETQTTINAWQREKFGATAEPIATAVRMVDEAVELCKAILAGKPVVEVAEEVADQIIFGNYLGMSMGFDVQEAVNRKMGINRARDWEQDGTGHFKHVKAVKPDGV